MNQLKPQIHISMSGPYETVDEQILVQEQVESTQYELEDPTVLNVPLPETITSPQYTELLCWIFECTEQIGCNRETRYLSKQILDICLSQFDALPPSLFQLLGACSIRVALMFREGIEYPLQSLAEDSGSQYSQGEIAEMLARVQAVLGGKQGELTSPYSYVPLLGELSEEIQHKFQTVLIYVASDARSFKARPQAMCLVAVGFFASIGDVQGKFDQFVGSLGDEALQAECDRLRAVLEELEGGAGKEGL